MILPADEQLQACNWQIANPTTPANYFHLLRRQIHREFRKPLIVASTKNLLRHKLAHSSFADLTEGTKFHRVLPEAFSDELTNDDKVKRLLICSGKLYYELLEERRASERDDVAIVRIEQLSPFPSDRVAEEVARYPNAELVWAQEEPMNMGAWQFMEPRISEAVKQVGFRLFRFIVARTARVRSNGLNCFIGVAMRVCVDQRQGNSATLCWPWPHGVDGRRHFARPRRGPEKADRGGFQLNMLP